MIVVDASVAVKWFVPEPGSEEADALLGGGVPLAAPGHLAAEVGQALLRHRRAGGATLEHVKASLSWLKDVVSLRPTSWFVDDAVEIADACRCSIYDALYLAAAERWDCSVVTADIRLVRSLVGTTWANRAVLLRVGGGGSAP